MIQDRFLKFNDNMIIHIKEKLRNIAYPETTDLKPSSQPVKTKGASKKLKPTSSDTLMVQSLSYFEDVDNVFRTRQLQNFKKKMFSKELELAKHILRRLRQRFHLLTRYRFLCTNKLSGSSILKGEVIAVIELFRLNSVNEKIIIHLSLIKLSMS